MDINTLFKVPKLPTGSSKRKMPDNPTPEVLKRMKLDDVSLDISSPTTALYPNTNSKNPKGHEIVEQMDGGDQQQNFAPGGDADYFAEEDSEGRFFGGGLTSEQKEILNIFEDAGTGPQNDIADELSITAIRRMLLQFERAVNKNQDQRSKYPNDPSKFIDSEADLDSTIKALLPLAQAPQLAYPELVRSGAVTLLVGLLAHENADIVIDVVEVVHELTDEDVGNEGDSEGVGEAAEESLKSLIQGLLDNTILELLVDNLPRLNEQEESDRQGVFHILGIFENIVGFNPDLSSSLFKKTTLLTWLLKRIQSKTHNENRSYAAELLSILLQDDQPNRVKLGQENGIEILLNILSQYRRRDPADADETEFMENIFDILCSALNETTNKKLFLSAEGPDLMLLMMKEKLQSRSRSIKTLDFAMSGTSGSAICEVFVEALGLKTLFSALMGKAGKKQKSNPIPIASQDTAHILGIISSLFSNIASDSPSRIRLLTKFVESNYEKVDKLLEIRDTAKSRIKVTEHEINQETEGLDETGLAELEDTLYLRRLDGGLYTLQTVDYILAWVIMEDDGIRTHALQMLDRKNQSLNDIVQTLQIFYANVDDISQSGVQDVPSQKEILHGLITALDISDVK
ncbi:Catenin-beta-like protein [Collybia nuda]|uniref:Catenin-beta-like protein n=1 Tax=Collybia nuda TaxID=64659 RepID=A0A9P5YC36_9AGAR|nr:Catenin-beta-like protein [Collybia nuda]